MNAWKRVLFEEYLNYKYKKNFDLDNWFPYSGMIEHNNKIVYKKNTSAIDLDVIKIKTIVIKNDMTKYKLKRNVK
tara:strand:- start:395 stop:619 length:225 start_codon:yes stop_codon:yes gene_type:complete